MTLTLLLIATLAAGLTPLILRDLRRAAVRRQRRAALTRFRLSMESFTAAMRGVAQAAAVTAERVREFGAALRQDEQR